MCCSRLFLASKRKYTIGHPVYDPKNHKFLRLFQRVGIGARTVELLYEFFLAIDVDNSGEISLSEFFNFFRMKDTAFARRAFSVMDEDGSGEIDFGEFTLTLYNFCSFTREGLTRFAFELYDADGSGTIDMDEAMGILKEMFGRKYKTNATANKIARQMESFDWRQNSGIAYRCHQYYHPPHKSMKRTEDRHCLRWYYSSQALCVDSPPISCPQRILEI